MDRTEVTQLFALFEVYWPNKKITRSIFEAWALVLEHYDYEQAKAATAKYAGQNKYFPDPADITGGLPSKESNPHGRSDLARLNKLLDKQKKDG